MASELKKRQAVALADYGIDVILMALARHCSRPRACNDCQYINDSDGTCNALTSVFEQEGFEKLDEVPYGDRASDESDYADDYGDYE